jgi:hypothetical protein
VIGTLVGEAERAQAEESPPPSETPAPPARAPTFRSWLGAEAFGGPALDDGTWRVGAGLVAIVDLPVDGLLASGTARYAMRPSDRGGFDAHWVAFSAGVGLHHAPAPAYRRCSSACRLRSRAVRTKVEAFGFPERAWRSVWVALSATPRS